MQKNKEHAVAKVVIIGAGLTGLSVAYHLEKNGFFDYQIFEKESEIGGLCRSISQDGFTFDFTGHFLHCNNSYFENFLEHVVGKKEFNTVTRKSFIFSHNVHTHYPFQTNLYGLPTDVISDCVTGFIDRPQSQQPKNYHEWVLTHFGEGFGKHFFFPYQKKIFCTDPQKLAHSWTGRFVPSTTFKQIIFGALINKGEEKIGYNATFLYPKKGGISLLIKKLQKKLTVPIKKNFYVDTVDLQTKRITFSNGHTEPFTELISTMPLNILLQAIQDRATTAFHTVHKKLQCTSVLNINLGIARKNLTEKSWIYYPEKKFPFYRIGFPHTFCKNMTPTGCSSLYAEVGYLNKTEAHAEKKIDEVLQHIKTLFGFSEKEIVTKKILHLAHAYVIYNGWREKNLHRLLAQLTEDGIHSVGRYGAWKYASMQEAIIDGKEVAEKIVRQAPTRSRKKPYEKFL